MSYIDRNFMYLTRAYLLSKSNYHQKQYDQLKKTKDVHLGNGLMQSDEHLASEFEYMILNSKVCEIVTKMQRVDNYRKELSSQIKE